MLIPEKYHFIMLQATEDKITPKKGKKISVLYTFEKNVVTSL